MNSSEFIKRALVIHNESHKTITITLRYVNEEYDIDRVFNFERKTNEKTSRVLLRIGENIRKIIAKKSKNKGVDSQLNTTLVLKNDESCKKEFGNASCFNTLVKDADLFYLRIDAVDYSLIVNPPIMMALELPKNCIMAGFPIYPSKFEVLNCNVDDICFKWYRSQEKLDGYNAKIYSSSQDLNWEEIGEGFQICTSDEEVSRLIKVVGTPWSGLQKGIQLDCISNVAVTPGPGPCPFERRHKFTSQLLKEDFFRVASYNILADMYADSDYSRLKLYPYCPPHALNIDYRKQLFIKEIIGYNADLLCLQEVDKKVFLRDLAPVLSHYGLKGVYDVKGGSSVCEGIATFYREDKFSLKHHCFFLLNEALDKNPLFKDLQSKIKQNRFVYKTFKRRGTILQVTVFSRKSDPSQVIVFGGTHLYFEPFSDHIRIIQGGMCLSLLRQVMDLQKAENSVSDVSLLFCGDFNSSPENAVYRLMTCQLISEDDPDWKSKPGEEVEGVSFSHDLEIASACGTPDFTNYTVGFVGCLDYIFYEVDKLSLEQSIPLPSLEEVKRHTALPSVTCPSDHVALVADFKWTK